MSALYGRLSSDYGERENWDGGKRNQDRTKRAHNEIRATVQSWTFAYTLTMTKDGKCLLTVKRLRDGQDVYQTDVTQW